ncbi:MAG TPA: cyanophycinase [Blastocatellia bacterium]|nr:cyanophycinase [Blastocatellia bacterium]
MSNKSDRTLIVIGGHEDKVGSKLILKEVARRVGSGRLVVTTVASKQPDGLFEQYERIFRNIGVKHLAKLEIKDRSEAADERKVRILDDANAVFFTGGDQLKITSQIGDSLVYRRVMEIYESGGVIAGTSAGASVLCETMIVNGGAEASHRVEDSLKLASGLGLIGGVIIDQHFAERGRMGRLLGAIAQNPKNVGVGIDEDTAIVIEREQGFYVLGSGAVYVVDGETITYSNITEEEADKTVSMYDLKLHVLSQGDRFDLSTRRPEKLKGRAAKALAEKWD